MNPRNRMTRCAVITGLLGAATVLTAPQAMATGAHTNAVSSTVKTTKPLGRLGPLTDIMIERVRVSDDVAASKFGTDSPIEDPVREEQVLQQVRTQADAVGVDPDVAVAFFRDQITASKVVQKGLFARWTAHPEEAPTTRPDLGQIRVRFDRLTTDLLHELKKTERLRDKPVGCAAQLALAIRSGAALERLDPLHRQALNVATRSVCRSSEPAGQR
ncbi:chorismate mutase [Nonomuraea terrae]|uniref:chorismate mutase n=1 Tax=Nonomuraea terrae TaxID=2530383 RepID=UPI00379CBE2C